MRETSNAALSSPTNGAAADAAGALTPSAATAMPSPALIVPAPDSAPPAVVDEGTGPITRQARRFFEDADTVPRMPPAPPLLVPLPKPGKFTKKVEMSGGVMVVERAPLAWIATGIAVVLGVAIAIVLEMERVEARDALRKNEADLSILHKRAADAEAALLAQKDAPAPAPTTPTAADDAAKVTPIVAALNGKLKKELARGDAKIEVDGARVKVVVGGAALFDGKKLNLAKRSDEVLRNIAAALNAPGVNEARVDVVAHTEATASRNGSEFGNSAARSTNIVRFLSEKAGVDAKRLSVIGRGNAEPVGKSAAVNRRIELVLY